MCLPLYQVGTLHLAALGLAMKGPGPHPGGPPPRIGLGLGFRGMINAESFWKGPLEFAELVVASAEL